MNIRRFPFPSFLRRLVVPVGGVCVGGGGLEFSDAPWVVQAASGSFQQGLAIGCFFVIGVVLVLILGLELPASVLHLFLLICKLVLDLRML